jgi:AAA domain-containing protein
MITTTAEPPTRHGHAADLVCMKCLEENGYVPVSEEMAEAEAARRDETDPPYYSLADYLALAFDEPVWRIKNLCETQGIGLIGGGSKHGKTALAVQFGLCIASGKPFMGNEVLNPAPVLYIEQEGNQAALHEHIRSTATALAIDASRTPFYVRHRKETRIDSDEGIAELRRIIAKSGAKVVIVGPLAFLHRQKSEDDAALMAPLMAALNRIATDLGVFIFLAHHTRKASGMDTTRKPSSVFAFFNTVRGSGAFIGHVDIAIGLFRSPKENAGTLYVLNRNGADFMLGYDFDTETHLMTPRDRETADEKAESETDRHLRRLIENSDAGELTIDDIAVIWSMSDRRARDKLGLYVTKGLIKVRIDTAQKGRAYYHVTTRGISRVTEEGWVDA